MQGGASTQRSGRKSGRLDPRVWERSDFGAMGWLATWIPVLIALLLLSSAAAAQTTLLDALSPETPPSEETPVGDEALDPLTAIEAELAAARRQRDALAQTRVRNEADEASEPSASLELAARRVRVLEQRREAQIRHDELAAGRQLIEAGLAREPRELFGEPPPFPVPILDGVLRAWRSQVEQETRQQAVLDDRRANLKLARKVVEDLEREGRRVRDLLKKKTDEVERVRLETESRGLEDQLAVAREQAALARQRVANATIELELKQIATRQAHAALAWVENHLVARQSDLADAIEQLDRRRFEIERGLDASRAALARSEAALDAAEAESDAIDRSEAGARALHEAELTTRRRQLGLRQKRVALLSQRIERIARMRTAWQHRYAVLGDTLDLAEVPEWRRETNIELERLTRQRRIQENELARLRLELANLLTALAEPGDGGPGDPALLEQELDDLEALVALYEADLASLDGAIALEDRLEAELDARLENRDIGERVKGAADAFRAFWSYELTASEDSPITPGKLVLGLFIFTGGYFLARLLMGQLARRIFPRLGFDAGASNAFASLTFYALVAPPSSSPCERSTSRSPPSPSSAARSPSASASAARRSSRTSSAACCCSPSGRSARAT